MKKIAYLIALILATDTSFGEKVGEKNNKVGKQSNKVGKQTKTQKTLKQKKSRPSTSRCTTPGKVDALGLYCPGQDDVDAFVHALNAWGQTGDLETTRALWEDSDDTIICGTVTGCARTTDAIIASLNGLGYVITPPYSYSTDNQAWESGPGTLILTKSTELFTSTGGCEFEQKFQQILYYNAEGKITQAHNVIIPADGRATFVGQASSGAVCDCDVPDHKPSGIEIFKQVDPKEVEMKIDSTITVNGSECTYEIDLSFKPDLSLPYMGDATDNLPVNPTFQDLHPDDADYSSICAAEGSGAYLPIANGDHVGNNVHNTEYTYTLRLPKRTRDVTGFDHLTIGAAPCGTFFQPFPHYGVHFYTITEEYRSEMKCATKGNFFCLSRDFQSCSDVGTKMQMDGVGIPTCDDGTQANIPKDFMYTTDGVAPGVPNAATPAIGLHALNFATLDPSVKPNDQPNLLAVGYDSGVTAHMQQVYAGFAMGKSSVDEWEIDNIEYNCQDMKRYGTLPTRHYMKYDKSTGRTSFGINGPAKNCDASFSEVVPDQS